MIVIAALIIGAFFGWYRAGRIDGNLKDRAQYAAVHAIMFALIGLFATIAIDRFTR